jgi:hypothetical protein
MHDNRNTSRTTTFSKDSNVVIGIVIDSPEKYKTVPCYTGGNPHKFENTSIADNPEMIDESYKPCKPGHQHIVVGFYETVAHVASLE